LFPPELTPLWKLLTSLTERSGRDRGSGGSCRPWSGADGEIDKGGETAARHAGPGGMAGLVSLSNCAALQNTSVHGILSVSMPSSACCPQHAVLIMLSSAYCLQHAVLSMLSSAYCPQHAVLSMLSSACRPQHAVLSMLSSACCPQYAVLSMLSSACCRPRTGLYAGLYAERWTIR
jgi:hypothetical protein